MTYTLSEDLRSLTGIQNPVSIYAFAPVFKGIYQGEKVVLKRTRAPLARAAALQDWLRPLKQSVHALHLWEHEQHIWVMYPFIEGKPYTGSLEQCEAAGELLGQIHNLPPADFGSYVMEPPADLLDTDRDTVNAMLSKQYISAETAAQLHDFINTIPEVYTQLLSLELPEVTASWDYKANNLVFTEPVVLIDPDSSGNLPRLLDLALACLLFHNESPPQNDLWSQAQWQAFLRGYGQHITLTPAEKECWPLAKQWMYYDEALWLLSNAKAAEWTDPAQGAFLKALVNLDLESRFLMGR